MIFFVGNGGTIVKGLPEPVYQGAANANTVYLVAPFASNGTVTVAFQLPNGTAAAPAQMTAQGEISGITDENGNAYSGWLYDLPNAVTALYGVVTAQFYFYNAQGKITASSATSFTVGRGVPAVLPDEPSEDVYEQILSNIAALQTDLNNGFYAARAIYAWNSTYTYGANEITYYPVGTYGAFVKSVQANNTGNTPYVDGAVNSAYWEEVLNFDAAIAAAETAQAAAEAAQVAAEAAEDSAQEYANAAQGSAQTAEAAQEQAEGYAEAAEGSASAAAESAGEAAASAASAQNSADLAQGYMEQAKDYAKKEYKVYESFDDLPIPGDSAFIYLVPSSGGTSNDSYSEYLWISEDNKYEYIGSVNDVDLSNYAQINGNYQGMTVGAATKATRDGAGNVISDTYAKKNDIGLVQQIDEPLPVPTKESIYIVQSSGDMSAYLKKVYETEDIIYPPASDYSYYLVVQALTGASFSGYKIVWANSAGVRFLGGSALARISGALYISSNDYSSVNEAEAALKTSVTEYTQATFLTYFYRNSSSATVSFPVVNSNINSTVQYPSSYKRRLNGVVYEYTWSYSDADPYNPFSGYVDGTAPKSQYVKIIDADDAQNYATKEEVAAKYTKPADGIPETDLAADVQTSLGKADTALQSIPVATPSALGGVKPVAKTDDMTQSVGVDENGALFTAPSGGGDTPDIPTPSASDNGDLLGVSNGAYALIAPSALTVGKATNATNDGNGDNIANTYVKKSAVKYQHNVHIANSDNSIVVVLSGLLLPGETGYSSTYVFLSALIGAYDTATLNCGGNYQGFPITQCWAVSASGLGVSYMNSDGVQQSVTIVYSELSNFVRDQVISLNA